MPHHCCVPGCVSNSKAAQCADVSFHSFPTDPSRRRAWIGRVRRDVGPHFSLNSHTKVCSRHFQEHDFYPGDRRRSGVICHERRKLKPDAVPSTFPFQVESRKRKPPAERLPLPKKSKTKEKKPEVCQGDVDGDSETGKNEDKGPRLPERTPDLFGTSAADEDGPKQDDTSQLTPEPDSLAHDHCPCVSSLSEMLADSYADVAGLQERCRHLEMKLSSLSRPPTHSTTGIDLIKGDDKAACFYTGFRSFLLFMACFNFLEPAAKVSLLLPAFLPLVFLPPIVHRRLSFSLSNCDSVVKAEKKRVSSQCPSPLPLTHPKTNEIVI